MVRTEAGPHLLVGSHDPGFCSHASHTRSVCICNLQLRSLYDCLEHVQTSIQDTKNSKDQTSCGLRVSGVICAGAGVACGAYANGFKTTTTQWMEGSAAAASDLSAYQGKSSLPASAMVTSSCGSPSLCRLTAPGAACLAHVLQCTAAPSKQRTKAASWSPAPS